MLRDIQKGDDPQIEAVLSVITAVKPDILVLGGIDWDYDGRAIGALKQALQTAGHGMAHHFAGPTNRGVHTGLDMDQDGRLQEPEDAIGFARFTGGDSLAVFSQYPIDFESIRDDTQMLWADLPNALLPYPGQPDGLDTALPLSTTAHWIIPIQTASTPVWIGTFFATPPVFDGPEDRNGRRNHDEVMYWANLLDGTLKPAAPDGLIIAGHANLDPKRGQGRRAAIQTLIDHTKLDDPHGDQITVDWRRDDLEDMRVSYVLPDTTWHVVDAGVYWPASDTPEREMAVAASRHRLVWVDVIAKD